MAKENENLESTEETVEEVVADKDAEQEHLDRQKEEEESIALASEKAKEKARIQKEKARIQKEEAEEKARIQKEEADKQQNIKFQMISNLKKTILIFDSNIYMNSIYEDIFHFLRENNFNNLLMFQEQYDEISNLQIYE